MMWMASLHSLHPVILHVDDPPYVDSAEQNTSGRGENIGASKVRNASFWVL